MAAHRLPVPRVFFVQVQARRGQRHALKVIAHRAHIKAGVGLMRAGRMPRQCAKARPRSSVRSANAGPRAQP